MNVAMCKHRVSSGAFFKKGCGNRAKYDPDENGVPTACHLHSKEGRDNRQEKRRKDYESWTRQYERDAVMRMFENRIKEHQKTAEDVLKQIAYRYDDNPIKIAQDYFYKLDELKADYETSGGFSTDEIERRYKEMCRKGVHNNA